jgi:hypothetical protein
MCNICCTLLCRCTCHTMGRFQERGAVLACNTRPMRLQNSYCSLCDDARAVPCQVRDMCVVISQHWPLHTTGCIGCNTARIDLQLIEHILK